VNKQTAHLESMSELLASGLAGHQHLFNGQAVQFMETRMCTYCIRNLEDDDCNIVDDLCNQLCCDSCLFCSASSESWWGYASDLALEEEDSFDIDPGAADDTLREEVPWHVMVSAMKSNQKLVPSTGGSKRNFFRHESKAVRMEVDKKRKQEERNRKTKEADQAELKRTKPRDIHNFFGTMKVKLTASMYPSVLALLSSSPNFTEELQDLREELDAAVALTAVATH
jgi:hypothetical protein